MCNFLCLVHSMSYMVVHYYFFCDVCIRVLQRVATYKKQLLVVHTFSHEIVAVSQFSILL